MDRTEYEKSICQQLCERYFHMPDPDRHELSFARPLQ